MLGTVTTACVHWKLPQAICPYIIIMAPQTHTQSLATTLKNLQADVRERIAEKRTELENLPVESGRIDLVSYVTPSPTQYTVVFPSQR